MSVDVCAVRRGGAITADYQGRTIRVFPVTYFCQAGDLVPRISAYHQERRATLHLQIDSMAAAWDRAGEAPEFIVQASSVEGIQPGDVVHRQTKHTGYFQWTDSNPFPGERVGTLTRNGSKWVIVAD